MPIEYALSANWTRSSNAIAGEQAQIVHPGVAGQRHVVQRILYGTIYDAAWSIFDAPDQGVRAAAVTPAVPSAEQLLIYDLHANTSITGPRNVVVRSGGLNTGTIVLKFNLDNDGSLHNDFPVPVSLPVGLVGSIEMNIVVANEFQSVQMSGRLVRGSTNGSVSVRDAIGGNVLWRVAEPSDRYANWVEDIGGLIILLPVGAPAVIEFTLPPQTKARQTLSVSGITIPA